MNYKKFALMLVSSFILMYFVMFLNMNSINDYHSSLTRIYMTILMVSPMAVLMLIMMPKMYDNKKINKIVILLSVVFFTGSLTALRQQAAVDDSQYLKAMIPHHSSAIMTSKNANIRDPEVRKLADSIIASQQREIDEMNIILERLSR